MPIHIDIDTRLREQAIRESSHLAVEAFGAMGFQAGDAFMRELSGKMSGLSGIFSKMGAAGTGLAAASAAAIVLSKTLIEVGEEFEGIHKQLLVFTSDSAQGFDELSRRADNMVSTLDTSTKALGSTMAILETRLRTGPSDALDALTRHVVELKDRLGEFNISELAGAFRQWGITIDNADSSLATMLETSRRNSTTMQELVNVMAVTGPNLRALNLSFDQASELSARLASNGLNATQALTMLTRAEKAAATQHEDVGGFIRNEIVIIEELRRTRGEAAADEESFLAFGIRNWPLAADAAKAYVDVTKQAPGSFSATTESMDRFIDKTKQLHNEWNKFLNDLKPVGTAAVDALSGWINSMDKLISKHKDLNDWVHILVGSAGAKLLGVHPDEPEPAKSPYKDWYQPDSSQPGGGANPWFNYLNGGPPPAPGPPPPMPAPGAPGGPPVAGGAPTFGPPIHGAPAYDPNALPGSPNRKPLTDQEKAGKLPPAPQLPYPTEYGQPPAPGESVEHWQKRMGLIDARHDVSEKEARVQQLEKDNNATQDQIIRAQNELNQAKQKVLKDELEIDKPKKQQGPQIPYGPGYGGNPLPGETDQQYSARQGYLQSQHRTATAEAELAQVRADPTHTAEDLTKAENSLADARRGQVQSALQMNDSLRRGKEAMDEFGLKLDQDFGLSRGLPGLAENLIRFVGSLAAAPVMGAMKGAQAGLGGVPDGAAGLFGIMGIGAGIGQTKQGGIGAFPGSGSGGLVPGSPGGFSWPFRSGVPSQYPAGGAYPYAPGVYGPAGYGGTGGGAQQADFAGAHGPMPDAMPNGLAYGLPAGANVSGAKAFPPWVQAIAARFNLTPSTYGGHQESNRGEAGFAPNPQDLNRGIDWNGSPEDMERFADFAREHPELFEQFIHNDPGSGKKTGIAGGRLVGPGTAAPGYYADDWGGHGDHDHTRFSQGFDIAPSANLTGAGGAAQGWNADWNRIAQGESSGNWKINSGNGFYGGLQFTLDSWKLAGGTKYAPRPDLASPFDQARVAETLLGMQGPGAWPHTFVPGSSGPAQQPLMMAAGGEVPIVAHSGEHMLTASDVSAMGGQSAVYAFRQSLHPGATQIGGTGPPRSTGSGFGGIGTGGLLGAATQNLPGFAGGGGIGDVLGFSPQSPPPPPPPPSPPPQIGPFPVPPNVGAAAAPAQGWSPINGQLSPVTVSPGGGINEPQPPAAPSPPDTNKSPFAGLSQSPNAPKEKGGIEEGLKAGLSIQLGAGAPPGPNAPPAPQPPGGPQPGPSVVGGTAPPKGYGKGFDITGGGIIGLLEQAPGMAAEGAGAMAPGGGAAGGMAAAAMQIGINELNRGIGALGQAGGALLSGAMQTFLPAGTSDLANNNWITRWAGGIIGAKPQLPNIAGPKGKSTTGLTPEQQASLDAGTPHGPPGAPPGPGGPTQPSAPVIHIDAPEDMVKSAAPHYAQGGEIAPNGPPSPSGPLIHIENYHVGQDDGPRSDLQTQGVAMWNANPNWGGR